MSVIAAALLVGAAARVAMAEEPKVTITGGADVTAHNYSWAVKNDYTSPIVHVEFPHYQADLFSAPEGWTVEAANLVGRPPTGGPSVCKATAAPASGGIAPGQSGTFTMRIAASGAQRGTGTVRIRFADGKETSVGGVELPRAEETQTKLFPLIGLAVIFVAVLAIRAWRHRPPSDSDEEEPSDSVSDA